MVVLFGGLDPKCESWSRPRHDPRVDLLMPHGVAELFAGPQPMKGLSGHAAGGLHRCSGAGQADSASWRRRGGGACATSQTGRLSVSGVGGDLAPGKEGQP